MCMHRGDVEDSQIGLWIDIGIDIYRERAIHVTACFPSLSNSIGSICYSLTIFIIIKVQTKGCALVVTGYTEIE